ASETYDAVKLAALQEKLDRALHFANTPDIATLLLDAGANPNNTKSEFYGTPLHSVLGGHRMQFDHLGTYAITSRQDIPGLYKLLLERKADPNILNGNESILYVAICNRVDNAILLDLVNKTSDLSSGDTNASSKPSILDAAICYGQDEVVQAILKKDPATAKY